MGCHSQSVQMLKSIFSSLLSTESWEGTEGRDGCTSCSRDAEESLLGRVSVCSPQAAAVHGFGDSYK